jgi:ribosome maturation factor RimP
MGRRVGRGTPHFCFVPRKKRVVELAKELAALIERELSALGYELVKVETFFSGRRKLLRVFIDRPEGVTIDDCVRVSKALGLVLDGMESMPGPYNLEISSPGENRPLTKPEHFQRFIGSRARVEHRDCAGAKATAHGEIVAADAEAVTVTVDGVARRIPFDAVWRANLEPERRSPQEREGRGRKGRRGRGENF